MSLDVSALIRSWSAGACGQDVATLYTEDAVRVDVTTGTRTVGRRALARLAQRFHDACPDALFTVDRIVEAPATVVLEWTWEGTHTGDVAGWPARGEHACVSGCTVLDLDGRLIRRDHTYWDSRALRRPG